MTMRMEMTSFFDVLFNEVAQAKFVHTVSAGYVTAAVFVFGVSAWYLLKGRHLELARRSIAVAASASGWPRAVGRRAGRRVGLFGQPHAADETRRDRGDVGNRGGACRISPPSASPTRRRARRISPSKSRGRWA
jgi:hypothetical protein